jgi:hypothetical protein
MMDPDVVDAVDAFVSRFGRPEWAQEQSGEIKVEVFAVDPESGALEPVGTPRQAVEWERRHDRSVLKADLFIRTTYVIPDGPLAGHVCHGELDCRGDKPLFRTRTESPWSAWEERTTARAMKAGSLQPLYDGLPHRLAQSMLTVPVARRLWGHKPGGRPGRRGHDELWWLGMAELRVEAEAASPKRPVVWMVEQLAARHQHSEISTVNSIIYDLRHEHGLLTPAKEPVALTAKALEIKKRAGAMPRKES